MAKDCLGNELKIGDLVQLNLDKPVVYGRVVKMQDGGISLVGGTRGSQPQHQVTVGNIEINADLSAQFDPRDERAPGVVKVSDPDAGKKTGLLAN